MALDHQMQRSLVFWGGAFVLTLVLRPFLPRWARMLLIGTAVFFISYQLRQRWNW